MLNRKKTVKPAWCAGYAMGKAPTLVPAMMAYFLLVCVCVWSTHAEPPIQIGDRRELFVDRYLVDTMQGVELRLHHPTAREIVIDHDQTWEGNVCAYHTVFKDGDIYRMYYRGSHFDPASQRETHEQVYCYAESVDGIHWKKPELGLIEFDGSTKNNIVLKGIGSHNLAPFRDDNPDCPADQKYKALGGDEKGLYAFKSADGLRWELLSPSPVITDGVFDSQNLAFWDPVRKCYVEFHRDFRDGIRDIKTCTSTDFVNWSHPQWLSYGDAPAEHLYTNQITPYARAPHIYMGFPMRLIFDRNPIGHDVHEVSDGVFMTSRDGRRFTRWLEAIIRPGAQRDRWVNRNNMTAWGIVETASAIPDAPNELSIYVTEGYYTGHSTRLRRYTTRLDGFVSVHAGSVSGGFTTYPLDFSQAGDGSRNDRPDTDGIALHINYATSAAGYVLCELLDGDGDPIPGFTFNDCDEIYGDQVDRVVSWRGKSDLSFCSGKPIRLRFKMYDSDLYSIGFFR